MDIDSSTHLHLFIHSFIHSFIHINIYIAHLQENYSEAQKTTLTHHKLLDVSIVLVYKDGFIK